MTDSLPGISVSTFTKTLLVLTVVTGLVTVIGIEIVSNPENPEIRYSAELSEQRCEPLSHDRNATNSTDTDSVKAREYTEVSPEAQEIFRLTLNSDGAYTTRTDPDDIAIQTDYPKPNHILYKSECFELTGQSTRNQNAPFYAFVLRMVGSGFTAIFAVATVVSLLWTTARQRGNDS